MTTPTRALTPYHVQYVPGTPSSLPLYHILTPDGVVAAIVPLHLDENRQDKSAETAAFIVAACNARAKLQESLKDVLRKGLL